MNQQSVSIIENLPITKHSFSKSFINDVYTKWKHCENEWLDEKVVLDVSPIQFQDSLNNQQLEQVSTFDETVRNNLQNSSGFNQRFKMTLSSNIYTIFMFYLISQHYI